MALTLHCQSTYRQRVTLTILFLGLLTLAFHTQAHAQVTSLTLSSDPGDYIGGGQFLFFTSSDGTFTAQQNAAQGVSVAFNTPSFDHFWYLDFAAADNQLLTVGLYTGAVRFPFQGPGQPGLSVVGDGRGCNTATGSFDVVEVVFGASGDIVAFDATFEQHCEGAVPALRGEIRYNANAVVDVTAPSHVTAAENQNVGFQVTATDTQSQPVVLTASGLPSGASFTDHGNNTGTFTWTPTGAQAGMYLLTFQGTDALGNIGATFTQIMVIPPPPANDDFDQPTAVPSIPFTASEDVSTATMADDDPFCGGRNQTVWFAFSPHANMRVEANTFGSNYDTTLSVYTGGRGALTQLACNDDAGGTAQSRVRFDAVAGTTYYIMVSSQFPASAANLVFNVLPAPPPFSMTPTVFQFATVNPTMGMVTVSGTVTCSEPAFVSISGQVKQSHGNEPISGFFSVFVPCNGTTPWTVSIQPALALFHGRSAALFTGGKAHVSASAFGFDLDTGESIERDLSINITLRGAH